MVDWFLESGVNVFILSGGLLLICWGMGGDCSKGRPRCPKCWYDMRGTVPRLECPECGHDAGSERRLYMDRRGRKRITLGIVMVLLPAIEEIVWVCVMLCLYM